MLRRFWWLPVLCVAAPVLVSAQAPQNEPRELIADGGVSRTLMAAPVMGQPYSAVQVSQMVQTLADGTVIRNGPGPGHAVMRDSAGRVRIERWIVKPRNGNPGLKLVYVYDPNARELITWSSGGKGEKTAVDITVPADKPRPQTVQPRTESANAGRPKPVVTVEQLGAEMFDGVSVEAVKTTTIVPAGLVGNDAPIKRITEIWTSPDLKLIMKQQRSDPRTGELTVWLKDFSRAEPDPAMFHAPEGYTVKTMKQSTQELQQKLADAAGQM
jgi:hypothetical protein